MEIKFQFSKDYAMEKVMFEGLSGREYVTSTKDAVNVMKVRNPAVDFSRDVKAGLYDDLSDEEFQKALDTMRCINSLWHYPGDPESEFQCEMNVLMLLANAIELLSRQRR